MDKKYAQYLLQKTKDDYTAIADHFSRTRSFVWDDLKVFEKYITSGEKVLDLGCGNGRLSEIYKGTEYVGVDNSEKLIQIAKQKYPDNEFLVADAFQLPFPDNYFDKVFSIAVLHHIPSKELRLQFLKEVKRILKPKGLLIFTVWNLWNKRSAWKLFLKFTLLKLLRKSKLDYKDIFYPWKDQNGKIMISRYFHLFNKEELGNLLQNSGFKIREKGTLKRGFNTYFVAQKP
ncbi:class I SAM-dependent methyltransferase [Patescibacteria group bacterium]